MSVPPRISERGRWHIERFAELDSTNRYVLDAARAGAADGLVAVADVQTAGRGRLDRKWQAPAGSSLLVSVLVRAPAGPSRVVMAAGVAMVRAVADVAGVAAELKWPNDVVVRERKLAGVLAEADGDALVVGAGCNVNWAEFPPELAATATACNVEAGRLVDCDALLDTYLDELDRALRSGDGLIADYRALLATTGRRVRVLRLRDDELVGLAIAVTDDGALAVRDDHDVEHTVTAADVVHLRCPPLPPAAPCSGVTIV